MNMAFQPTQLKECNIRRENPVPDHAESLLPADKKWKLVWHDEFDGNALDESKWNFRTYFWGQKSPTWIEHEGVSVSDGTIKLHLVRKGDDFFSSHLQTGGMVFDKPKDPDARFWPFGKKEPAKFMHSFGYYECRCKLPKNSGWHAAFWLQAPGIGSHPDAAVAGVECDIMENYRQHTEGEMICGNGWGGYGAESQWAGHFSYPYEETEDGWHYYGVDWSEDGYTFYADGKLVGRQAPPQCPVSRIEQFLLISTECHGYNRVFGKRGEAGEDSARPTAVPELLAAKLPDCFEVDFVRVYDEVK